ncbi:MAG: phosphodiester glycosidase family protein [Christensenellales bacterium]|jgi:uncharacterized protein YigE (DUF2233 family)
MRIKRLLALITLLFMLMGGAQAADAAWFKPYDKAAGYTYVTFGRYPNDAAGTEAPILWRALQNQGGTVYLMSEYLIEVSRLHSVAFGYPGWKQADLNLWLNGEFIQKAFSADEAAALTEQPELGRVSLPSADDIKEAQFGFDSDKARRAIGTPWADSRGLFFYRHKGHSPYWTRTPSTRDFAHRTTKLEGNIGYLGVTADDLGVRPVIWLALDQVRVSGGSGGVADPYVLTALNAIPAATAVAMATPAPAAEEPLPQAAEPLPEIIEPEEETEAEAEEVTEEAAAEPVAQAPAPQQAVSASGWAQTGHLRRGDFPELTPEGFLPEGQPAYIHIDAEGGKWRFADQTLRILIDKVHNEALASNVITAEIYLKEGVPGFRMVHHDPENRTVNRDAFKEKPATIAKNNKLVFTMNGDYYLYRVYMTKSKPSYPIGIIIRAGDVLFDKPPKPTRTAYPPLDNLALFPNGDMKVFKANEHSAKEFLAMGASDVLAFGPYLIRDGQINSFSATYGNTNQPRSGIGMVAPGHYFAAVVEGRIRGSKGTTVSALCEHLASLGCTTAYNLDGGDTSAMVFMGQQLNQLYKVNGKEKDRIQNEVMGIGYYENMQ